MNKTLESVKRGITFYLSDNQSASMVIPEKEQDKIIYKYFSYFSFEENGILNIYKISKMYEYNELNEQIQEKDLDELSNIVEIKGIKPRSYNEITEIENKYYDKLDKILTILYKDQLTEEEKDKIKEFKEIFDELIVEDMKKIYRKYFPEFMNWIENI